MMKVEWTDRKLHCRFCAPGKPGTSTNEIKISTSETLRLLRFVVEVLDVGHAVAVRVGDERLLGWRAVLRQRSGCLLVVFGT